MTKTELINDVVYEMTGYLTQDGIDRLKTVITVKLVNVQKRAVDVQLHLEGIESAVGTAYIMSGYEPADENSFDEPCKVSPREQKIEVAGGCCQYHIDGESVQVLRFQPAR